MTMTDDRARPAADTTQEIARLRQLGSTRRQLTPYRQRAKAQRQIGAQVDRLVPLGGYVFHARRGPGGVGHVDHAAVTAAGVFLWVDVAGSRKHPAGLYPAMYDTGVVWRLVVDGLWADTVGGHTAALAAGVFAALAVEVSAVPLIVEPIVGVAGRAAGTVGVGDSGAVVAAKYTVRFVLSRPQVWSPFQVATVADALARVLPAS